jgi:hypothetical protein
MHPSALTCRGVAIATAVWGVVFAVAHAYWAAGGRAWVEDDGRTTIGESLYIAFIALLGLAGAAVALGLCRPWGARIGRRRLRALARLGSVVLLIGVAIGVGRWLAACSLGDDGLAGIVITAYFLLGGVLYALLGWNSQRASTFA